MKRNKVDKWMVLIFSMLRLYWNGGSIIYQIFQKNKNSPLKIFEKYSIKIVANVYKSQTKEIQT